MNDTIIAVLNDVKILQQQNSYTMLPSLRHNILSSVYL